MIIFFLENMSYVKKVINDGNSTLLDFRRFQSKCPNQDTPLIDIPATQDSRGGQCMSVISHSLGST
jgi:hypothetical protein